jgi:hypothetical protein
MLWIFLAYSLFSAAIYLWGYLRRGRQAEEAFEKMEQAFGELNRMPPGVIMPIGSFHWQTLYWSHFPVLTFGGNVDEELLSCEEFMLVYGRYPYPSEHLERILAEYHVSYLVSDEEHLAYYLKEILQVPERFYRRVKSLYRSPGLMIFQVHEP